MKKQCNKVEYNDGGVVGEKGGKANRKTQAVEQENGFGSGLLVNFPRFLQKKNGRDGKEKDADSTCIFEEEYGKSKGIEEDGKRQASEKENRFLLGRSGCIYRNGILLVCHRVSFSFCKRWFYFSINFFPAK